MYHLPIVGCLRSIVNLKSYKLLIALARFEAIKILLFRVVKCT